MQINYQKELNPEQLEVVLHGDGPCLVLAGAGSGKTRTLVYRVAYLLEKGVAPDYILLATFTNKASKEMLGRVEKLLGLKPEGIWGGTFHHLGNRFLRRFADRLGYARNFSILDSEDSAAMVKAAMREVGVDVRGKTFPKPAVIESIIGFARNSGEDLAYVAEELYGFPANVVVKINQIGELYSVKKKAANAMDFDDLLVNWLEILRRFPEIKEKMSAQFKHILVDEYQDTNHIQAEIVRELSGAHGNILAVGDDSQSIYSFRAADVGNILNFPKFFPHARIFRIEKNYRSTPPILALANASIRHNRGQFPKTLSPERGGGALPKLYAARDEHQEAVLVARRIREWRGRGLDYQCLAVLYRSNYQSAEIQLALSKLNIPYVVRGGQRFFEQAHVKDVIAHLKIIANHLDEAAWRRVLLLADGLGERSVDKIWKEIKQTADLTAALKVEVRLPTAASAAWERARSLLENFSAVARGSIGRLGEAVELVMARGYENYLKNSYDNYRDRLDDLSQLVNFVANYQDLDLLLSDVLLSEDYERGREATAEAVILSTIHQAKGLEWPVVFIIGLRDGQFPHQKSLDNAEQMEEERRLFYVAVTRAKDELNLLYPVRSFSYKFGEVYARPSLFLRELPETAYSLAENEAVRGRFVDEDNDGEEVIYYD